jgi:MFS family permease
MEAHMETTAAVAATADTAPAGARAARVAVSVVFLASGAVFASILPRLPAIQDSLGLSQGELGTAVAALAVGGLVAGGFVGVLVGRFGSARLIVLAGTATALMLAVIGQATTWAMLAGAYLVLGMFDAIMDASMNAHGVGLQRVYGRSILQGFHGMWSVGGVVGSFVGVLAATAGVAVAVHLGVAAAILAIAILVAGRFLLPSAVADAPHDALTTAEPLRRAQIPHLFRVLVPIALLGILCVVVQGSAATWSAIFLSDVLGAPAGVAAAGFMVYMGAMVIGRLTNDRWVNRIGSTPLVRVGALVAGGGLVAVIASAPVLAVPLAFAGFALVGLGTSPMFPVMVSAAGSRPGIPSAHGIALASWLVRVGLIVAPALVGVAADAWGLAAALVIPLVAAGLVALLAPVLAGSPLRRRAEA